MHNVPCNWQLSSDFVLKLLQYTWTNDRLWRKNRRQNSGSSCAGVDLNRNYDDHWAEVFNFQAIVIMRLAYHIIIIY